MDHEEIVVPENARAVCGKELPPVSPEHTADGSILLFYQYVEDPIWTKAEHKAALKKVIEIGTKYNITGRGRVAREGLNCTLTGKPHDIRSFCYGLREWNDVFNDTDFKITDGVAEDKMFKALSIRKTNELVAYGLAGGKCLHGCGLFVDCCNWNEEIRAAVRQPLSRCLLALYKVPAAMAGVKCCCCRSFDNL